jgi:hypothetical protein
MATWSEFAHARPDLARLGTALLRGMVPSADDVPSPVSPWLGIGFLASLRADGFPRLAPVCPISASGTMLVALVAPKHLELQRDGRYALHAMLGPDDAEFSMRGRMTLADDEPTRAEAMKVCEGTGMFGGRLTEVVFELAIDAVHTAVWQNVGKPGTWPLRKGWIAR